MNEISLLNKVQQANLVYTTVLFFDNLNIPNHQLCGDIPVE